jgi:hypothetical protein
VEICKKFSRKCGVFFIIWRFPFPDAASTSCALTGYTTSPSSSKVSTTPLQNHHSSSIRMFKKNQLLESHSVSRSNGLCWTGKQVQGTGTHQNRKCWEVFETNAGYQVSRKATQTDKASLRCDSKDVKLSKFGYVQAWCHDYSTSKHCCLWLPPAPGAGATGMVPSAAAMAALTTLPATPSSYLQPLMLTMGGLLQSTYGEFEPWT